MSVNIDLKDETWSGINKLRVPLDGGGTQDFSIGGGSPTLQTKTKTYTPTESQQTESVTADNGYDGLQEVDVTVNAISSTYVGSGITRRTSTDLTNSGSVVSVPSGYYENAVSRSVDIGSVSAPSYIDESGATVYASGNTLTLGKYAVTNSPTIVAGYVSSATNTETDINLSATANILTAGTITPTTTAQTIPANTWIKGAQTISGDANLVAGNIKSGTSIFGVAGTYSGGSPNLQTKSKTYTPTTSQQTEQITADSGYDGLDEVDITVNAMPTGSVTAPSTISEAGASVTANPQLGGIILTKTASVTPNVTTPGYISSGTAGNCDLSLRATMNLRSTATIKPSASDQTIASNTYINGTQTYEGVVCTNLTAANIKKDVVVKIGCSSDDDSVTTVTGTLEGGSGIGTLIYTKSLGNISTSSTTATDTGQSLSLTNTGDYDLLIVETSVDTIVNNRHACTTALIWIYGTSTRTTKNGSAIATAKLNMKLSSSGVAISRSSTTAYGIYPNSVTVNNNNNLAIPMYQRYNSTQTGTINGNYTTRVYGVNLYELIGG